MCIDAIAELAPHNGLEYEKYARSEVRYRNDVLDKICEVLPPAVPFDTSHVHGRDRLCEGCTCAESAPWTKILIVTSTDTQ